MYSEILIRTIFKDFHIVPTVDNLFTYNKKDFMVRVNGFKDQLTPFDAYFYFANGEEWLKFKEEAQNKMLQHGKWEANRVKESCVVKDRKNKGAKTPYAKWIFYGVKKLY